MFALNMRTSATPFYSSFAIRSMGAACSSSFSTSSLSSSSLAPSTKRGGEEEVWSTLLRFASPGAERMRANIVRNPDRVSIMRSNMRLLGMDERNLPPTIHIAGTKGKGSTAAMTERILNVHGVSTLCYTSPHLTSVRERFRLSGVPVPATPWCDAFWPVFEACVERPRREGRDTELNFFSLLTLVCFALAKASRVDAMVLEVGVGGLTDATNSIAPEGLAVCGVTTLDWDHTEVLGDTLNEIAAQKAGIFKPGVPAFTAPQREDAMARLRAVATAQGAPLALAASVDLAFRCGGAMPSLSLAGDFQGTNAALAVALAETYLARVPKLREKQQQRQIALTLTPGTGNEIATSFAYLDGAHTDRSMRHAASWFREELRLAAAAHPHAEHVPVLVFNCPFEKDTLGLLLPLSTLPFKLAIIADVATKKPTLTLQPSVGTILEGFLARKRTFGDHDAVKDLQLAQAAEAATEFGTGTGAGVGIGTTGNTGVFVSAATSSSSSSPESATATATAPISSSSWQETLQMIWAAAHEDARLLRFRQRVSNPVPEYTAVDERGAPAPSHREKEAEVEGSVPSRVLLPSAAPPTRIINTTDEVLALLRSMSGGDASKKKPVHIHALVTGSLYLVGEILQKLSRS